MISNNRLNELLLKESIKEIKNEFKDANILVEKKTFLKERIGYFDIFVESNDKTIGFEILSRASKGKLKKKLSYSENVDCFIFVLPNNCLQNYKIKKKFFKINIRAKSFPNNFYSPNIYVWLYDVENKCFSQKDRFYNVFNVEKIPK